MSVGDEAGGEAEEGLVDVVAPLPADTKPAEAVEPGDGAFDDPAENAQARAVWLAAFGDHRPDTALPQQPPVLVVVVAAVSEEHVRPSSWPADDAGYRGNLVEQGQELGDVVAVSAGQ